MDDIPDKCCTLTKAYSHGPAGRWTLTEYVRLGMPVRVWAICSERSGGRDELELKAAAAGFAVMRPKTKLWYPRVWLGAGEISGELELAE